MSIYIDIGLERLLHLYIDLIFFPEALPLRVLISSVYTLQVMAATSCLTDHKEGEEEEYVLLDLDDVSSQVHFPPDAPYVLSGLDTMNPILIIANRWKLIGEYEETIGSCLVFTESEAAPVVHEETGPSEANLFLGKCIIDPKQAPAKQVKPIAQLHKILKFKLLSEAEIDDETAKQTNVIVNDQPD